MKTKNKIAQMTARMKLPEGKGTNRSEGSNIRLSKLLTKRGGKIQ